jgi:hypothetical protein
MFTEALETRCLMSAVAQLPQAAPLHNSAAGSASPGTVTGLELLDAATQKDLGPLTDGRTIAQAAGQTFAVRASTTGPIGSILFKLDGSYAHNENFAGYDLFGTAASGASLGGILNPGTHVLSATPYAQAYDGGAAGPISSVRFIIQPVTTPPLPVGTVGKLELMDAATQRDLGALTNDSAITATPGQTFAVRASTAGAIGSVLFQLDGSYSHIENLVAYDLFGTAANGSSMGGSIAAGNHTLIVTPYGQSYEGGAAGAAEQMRFSIVTQETTPPPVQTPPVARTPAPTPSPTPSPVGNPSGPVMITAGGTYSGNWSSSNIKIPAITIATSAPVTIINSRIHGGIVTSVSGAQVTITHDIGTGGGIRFADIESFKSAVITHNQIDGTEGIYLLGSGYTPTAVVVDNNSFQNITGDPSQLTQAIQLDKVQLGGAEIAWNQVINDPGASNVEDVISVYASGGTAADPLKIHDNYIQGAYPANPNDPNYSGGGIMLSDNHSAYVQAFNNQVLDTTNYGLAISSGHDNSIFNNRVLGLTARPASNVGIYIWNSSGGSFFNNTGTANRIQVVQASGARNDSWTPDASNYTGNTTLNSTDAAEWAYWQSKLAAEAQTVGA